MYSGFDLGLEVNTPSSPWCTLSGRILWVQGTGSSVSTLMSYSPRCTTGRQLVLSEFLTCQWLQFTQHFAWLNCCAFCGWCRVGDSMLKLLPCVQMHPMLERVVRVGCLAFWTANSFNSSTAQWPCSYHLPPRRRSTACQNATFPQSWLGILLWAKDELKVIVSGGLKLNGFWRAGRLCDTCLWLYNMRIHIYIYTYICTHICTCVHIYMYVCLHVCVYVRRMHTCRHRMIFVLTRLKVNSRLPSNVEEELVTLAMEQVEAEKCQAVCWWRSDFEILSGDLPRYVAEDCRSSLWFGARWFGWVVWCCNAAVARN